MSQSLSAVLQCKQASPEDLERKRTPAIYQLSDCSHSPRWALRELRIWQHRILTPDSWGAYQRKGFCKPRLLNLPTHRKVLYSLRYLILTKNNLLMLCKLDCGGTRDHIANIIEKAREFQKNAYFFCIHYTKPFHCVDHNKLWKILKEMEIPDHLTCLLRNLYAGQEPTVKTKHGTTDWFQIGKGVRQGCIL